MPTSMFPSVSPWETLRSRENKIQFFPRGWPLSALIIYTIPHNNILKSSLSFASRHAVKVIFSLSPMIARPMPNARSGLGEG